VESLSGHSLLVVSEDGEGEPRFAMLATIREYAAEQLDTSDEAADIRLRHADAYVELAEEAAPHLIASDAARWNDRLEIEHDNERAAHDHVVALDRADLGMRLVIALWRFWAGGRGHLHEAAERIDTVLGLPSAERQSAALRSRAEAAAGGISWWRSRWDDAYRYYAAALEHARASGDRALLAEALYDAGFAAAPGDMSPLDRYSVGRPLFDDSLALYRELGDKGGEASCLWALGFASAADGDIAGAIDLGRQSLALGRELDDPFRIGWAAHLVGVGSLASGQRVEAAAMFGESLELWVDADDRPGTVLGLMDIAMLAWAHGREERRWQLAGGADRLRAETGADLAAADLGLLGYRYDQKPETDEQRGWFDAGAGLSLVELIALAREEVQPV
jgi:tetratricopeptide (TPR) repeat protein